MSDSNARLFTALLRQAGEKEIEIDGVLRSRQEVLASMAWDYLIEGEVTLPNGAKLTATSREWITALKWLFAQIDGKPPREPRSAPAPEPDPYPREFAADVDDLPADPVPAADHAETRYLPHMDPEWLAQVARSTVVGLQPKQPKSPRVKSVEPDGRVVWIEREEYERRMQGSRSGSRYLMGDPDRHYAHEP